MDSQEPIHPPEPGTLEKLQGDWYGVEITNHLIAQGLWDTIHPQSITMMTLGIDTLTSTAIVDSAGTTLDTAALVVDNDSSITVTGNTSNLGWAFDADLISAFGQPVLDSLRVLFRGEKGFLFLILLEEEASFYFDTIFPFPFEMFFCFFK